MQQRIRQCLDWFEDHARRHETMAEGDVLYMVREKITHTHRVLANTRGILEDAGLDGDTAAAAEIAAILHDAGRFPQLVSKATFDDTTGLNHGEEGARLLESIDLLDPLPEAMRHNIITAVRYHNRDRIPDGLTGEACQLLEIVRDADKLDVLRTNIRFLNPDAPHGKAMKAGLVWHDTAVSDKVVERTRNRQLIPFSIIKWSNDFILFLLNWIHDLHYPYAYRMFRDGGHYEKLQALLPDSPPFDELKAQLRSDLDAHIDGRP